jgi:hypothetical protein
MPFRSRLVAAGLVAPDAELGAHLGEQQYIARVSGRHIEVNGTRFCSLTAAAASLTGQPTDGGMFWRTRIDDKHVPLATLRNTLSGATRT